MPANLLQHKNRSVAALVRAWLLPPTGTVSRRRLQHASCSAIVQLAGWGFLLLSIASQTSLAHSFEPCLLSIAETAPGEYAVHWRPPTNSAGYNLSSLDISPQFPAHCHVSEPSRRDDPASSSLLRLHCAEPGLPGSLLRVPDIDGTQLDVVVRINWLSGNTETAVLRSGASSYAVSGGPASSAARTAGHFLHLGMQHIALGLDHLAFVLALFLLVPTWRELITTVTAFTVGHSLTLALAATNWLHLPSAPVEAMIALSIAFVARDLLRLPEVTSARPWIMACGFGLLHGLGFASALNELGLPAANTLSSLLGFNLGVEAGQILFLGSLFCIARGAARFPTLTRARWLLPYALGGVACAWTIERVAVFWTARG